MRLNSKHKAFHLGEGIFSFTIETNKGRLFYCYAKTYKEALEKIRKVLK